MSSSSPRRNQQVVVTASPAPWESDSLRDSYFSEASQSTAPTSFHSTSGCQAKGLTVINGQKPSSAMYQPPAAAETLFHASSSSVATYDSVLSEMEPLRRDLPVGGGEEEEEEEEDDDSDSGDDDDDDEESEDEAEKDYVLSDPASLHIPPILPPYRGASNDPPARPSSPQDFARLFPSLDRLAVHHDDLTPDGNMNLRVDTLVPVGHGRQPFAVQLFHLRMHDLARREFSFRRYCRDSGREVCNSKRTYAPAPAGPVAAARPVLRRSMSSALKTVTTPFHRSSSTSSSFFKIPTGSNGSTSSDGASIWSGSHSVTSEQSQPQTPKIKQRMVPTNRIKLEFSNYARVDIARRGGRTNKRYEFEWWGHKYAWKRVIDKNLGVVSYHLVRDGHGAPVAHIVPEMRSPNQVLSDEMAGAWVAPCYMWISDNSVIDAVTDVADVIVATGLISLVDDSIKERWQAKKPSHRAIRTRIGDFNESTPRGLVHNLFHRRHSEEHSKGSGPLRFGRRPVAAY